MRWRSQGPRSRGGAGSRSTRCLCSRPCAALSALLTIGAVRDRALAEIVLVILSAVAARRSWSVRGGDGASHPQDFSCIRDCKPRGPATGAKLRRQSGGPIDQGNGPFRKCKGWSSSAFGLLVTTGIIGIDFGRNGMNQFRLRPRERHGVDRLVLPEPIFGNYSLVTYILSLLGVLPRVSPGSEPQGDHGLPILRSGANRVPRHDIARRHLVVSRPPSTRRERSAPPSVPPPISSRSNSKSTTPGSDRSGCAAWRC